ncbi:MAG: hypothetical protein ACKO37_00355 [Vampirovibrionales bacterium]
MTLLLIGSLPEKAWSKTLGTPSPLSPSKQGHTEARKQLPFLPPELLVTLNPALGKPPEASPAQNLDPITLQEALSEHSSSTFNEGSPATHLNHTLAQKNKQNHTDTLGWKPWIDASLQHQSPNSGSTTSMMEQTQFLEADLQLLWKETLIKNPVVRFCVGNLTSPASLNNKRSSLFVAKTLNTLIQGASVGTLLLPGGSLYRDMTVATVGQALSNLATSKLTPTQDARLLSQTELIQLAQVVDTLKLRLTDHYLALRHSLAQIERLEGQTSTLKLQYERAKQDGNTALAMMLGMTYRQTELKRLEAQEKFLASQQVLERLAGQGIVARLACITETLPEDIAGKTLPQVEQEALKASPKVQASPSLGEGLTQSPLTQVPLTEKEQAFKAKTTQTSPVKSPPPQTTKTPQKPSTKGSSPTVTTSKHREPISTKPPSVAVRPQETSHDKKAQKVKSADAMLKALDALTPPELPQDPESVGSSAPHTPSSTPPPAFRKRLWHR